MTLSQDCLLSQDAWISAAVSLLPVFLNTVCHTWLLTVNKTCCFFVERRASSCAEAVCRTDEDFHKAWSYFLHFDFSVRSLYSLRNSRRWERVCYSKTKEDYGASSFSRLHVVFTPNDLYRHQKLIGGNNTSSQSQFLLSTLMPP